MVGFSFCPQKVICAVLPKVFLITNIPPDEQYVNVDRESREAFFRRIHTVSEFTADGRNKDYPGVKAYLERFRWVEDAEKVADPSLF